MVVSIRLATFQSGVVICTLTIELLRSSPGDCCCIEQIAAELQQIWHPMLDRWNGGEPFTGDRANLELAEAIGVELPIYRLRQQGHDVVWINTGGHQGPDAILVAPDGVTPVFLEAKGTLRSVTHLSGSMFPEPSIGRQLSRDWLLNDRNRYLLRIENLEIRARVQGFLDEIENGAAYEAVVGRGALNANTVDYGSKLAEFANAINPGSRNSGWSMRFMFVNRP